MKNKYPEKQKNRRAGFTLIEIMLVVVIIGILAGIGIPAISGKGESARKAQAQNNIAMLGSGLQLYEMNNGSYPSSLDGLLDASKEGFPFLSKSKIPLDPWGNPFVYSTPGTHNPHTFDLSCTSRDGEIINNWD